MAFVPQAYFLFVERGLDPFDQSCQCRRLIPGERERSQDLSLDE